MSFVITSSAFAENAGIPPLYTCDGKDISPPLSWQGQPPSTKSLVLIVDDPDAPDPKAPRMTWVHWLLYNLPPSAGGLAEGVRTANLPAGTHEGKNDSNETRYGGPCPPIGVHRYFFKLYALDCLLPDLHTPTKPQLLKAMEGHILAECSLMGTYGRRR